MLAIYLKVTIISCTFRLVFMIHHHPHNDSAGMVPSDHKDGVASCCQRLTQIHPGNDYSLILLSLEASPMMVEAERETIHRHQPTLANKLSGC